MMTLIELNLLKLLFRFQVYFDQFRLVFLINLSFLYLFQIFYIDKNFKEIIAEALEVAMKRSKDISK